MSSLAPLRNRASSNGTRSTTTPLRIAKRDSPQSSEDQVTPTLVPSRRRSVRNLQDGARVSNSPFLTSQLSVRPTAFYASPTRRVSGEKRPRSHSMHDQAENENPAIRKRRQSQVSELLDQKKPVTNSSFKADRTSSTDVPRLAPREISQPTPLLPRARQPPPPTEQTDSDSELAPPPPPKEWFGRVSPHRSQSPARSSMASKRMVGPRPNRRRSRRKTVTFDERCDVLEFEAEEEEHSLQQEEGDQKEFGWVTDDDESLEDHRMNVDDLDDNHDHRPHPHHHDNNNDMYNNDSGGRGPLRVHNADLDDGPEGLRGDDSIIGVVDSMLQETRPRTPPHSEQMLPVDLETEGGVPYGRSHHADRLAAAHQRQASEPASGTSPLPLPVQVAAPSTPSHSREGTPLTSVSPGSHVPLGRSTHAERLKAQKEQEHTDMGNELQMSPPSPSPAKRKTASPSSHANTESLIPKYSVNVPKGFASPSASFDAVDPFSYPHLKDMTHPGEISLDSINHSFINRSREDPSNLSIGNSEISLSGLNFDVEPRSSTEERSTLPTTSTPPTSPPNNPFAFTTFQQHNFSRESLTGKVSTPVKPSPFVDTSRAGSPAFSTSRGGSPAFGRTQSPGGSPLARSSPYRPGLPKTNSTNSLLGSPGGSPSTRGPRITREAVQMKLEKKRSLESPLCEQPDAGFNTQPDPVLNKPSLDSVLSTQGVPTPSPHRTTPKRIPAPRLSRDNPTYDGVMFLDPEPQPIDPPRPAISARAASVDDITAPANRIPNSDKPAADSGGPMANLGDMRSALDRLMADVAGEATLAPDGKGVIGLKVEAVTEGIKAGRYSVPPSAPTPIEGGDESQDDIRMDDVDSDDDMYADHPTNAQPPRLEIPATQPEGLLHANFLSPDSTGVQVRPTSPRPISPRPTSPLPGNGNAIRQREEMIKAMKARKREEEEAEAAEQEISVEYYTPPRRASVCKPNRRRSRSTGDAGPPPRNRRDTLSGGGLLDAVHIEEEDDPLADSIDRELMKLTDPERVKYHIRERSETIYASSDVDKITHSREAGDIETGNVWRTVRRASDINEHAVQLREIRSRQTNARGCGKVFVRVTKLIGLNVPVPDQRTEVTIRLNNGQHYVDSLTCRLQQNMQPNAEFELLEQEGLEFTLVVMVPMHKHIEEQFRANNARHRPPPSKIPSPPASKGGMSRFFGKSKPRPSSVVQTPPPRPPQMPENLARYLKPDGTLVRAFVKYEDIAEQCNTKLFETTAPLVGQRSEVNAPPSTIHLGQIVIQCFRLPPLPGLTPHELPLSIQECHRGIRDVKWHKEAYYEGTLTQNGGDCMSWRRRHFRIVGGTMIAFNDVTKKAISTINLKRAVAVEDDQEPQMDVRSPDSAISQRSSRYMEHDGLYGIERSFRLRFTNDQEITFYADSDEEKAEWLRILRAIVGHVPSYPLWAELHWQRQQEQEKLRAEAHAGITSASKPSSRPPQEPSRVKSPIPQAQPLRPGSRQR